MKQNMDNIDELRDIGDRCDYHAAYMAGVIPIVMQKRIATIRMMDRRFADRYGIGYSATHIISTFLEKASDRQFNDYMDKKVTDDMILRWVEGTPISVTEFMEN